MDAEFEELFESFTEALNAQKRKLSKEARRISAEKSKLAEEQLKLATESNKPPANDIITLNVGGTLMTTTRRTLCQVKDSLLSIMFSGRWEARHVRDKDGHVFLDVDPVDFTVILKALRSMAMFNDKNISGTILQRVREDMEFSKLCNYFGLVRDRMRITEHLEHLHGTTRSDGDLIILGKGAVVSSRSHKVGIIEWTIDSLTNGDLMVGVLGFADRNAQTSNSRQLKTCFGWSNNLSYDRGSFCTHVGTDCFGTIKLRLDCRQCCLLIRFPNGSKQSMSLARNVSWYLHLSSYDSCSIRLVQTEEVFRE